MMNSWTVEREPASWVISASLLRNSWCLVLFLAELLGAWRLIHGLSPVRHYFQGNNVWSVFFRLQIYYFFEEYILLF